MPLDLSSQNLARSSSVISYDPDVFLHVQQQFERTSHDRFDVPSIDILSSDGHQMSFGGHHIAEQREMSVIDVGSVKDLHNVVDKIVSRVDVLRGQNCLQRRTISFRLRRRCSHCKG